MSHAIKVQRLREDKEADFIDEVQAMRQKLSPVAVVTDALETYFKNGITPEHIRDDLPLLLQTQSRGLVKPCNTDEVIYISLLKNKALGRPVDEAECMQADAALRKSFSRLQTYFVQTLRQKSALEGTLTIPPTERQDHGPVGLLFAEVMDRSLTEEQKGDFLFSDVDGYIQQLQRIVTTTAKKHGITKAGPASLVE